MPRDAHGNEIISWCYQVSIRSRLLCREMHGKLLAHKAFLLCFNPLSAVMPRDAFTPTMLILLLTCFNPLSAVMPRDALLVQGVR